MGRSVSFKVACIYYSLRVFLAYGRCTQRGFRIISHEVIHTAYETKLISRRSMPWLRRLVAGVSPHRPGFNRRPVHVGFVVDRVNLGRLISEYRLSPLIDIPSVIHIYSFICHRPYTISVIHIPLKKKKLRARLV